MQIFEGISVLVLAVVSVLLQGTGVDSRKVEEDRADVGVDIRVEAWRSSPFRLKLIESIGSFDESWYAAAVKEVVGVEGWEGSDSEDEADFDAVNGGDYERDESGELKRKSDEMVYKETVGKLKIGDRDRSFIDFDLVNNRFSPRIQAHYKHYEDLLERGGFGHRLVEECATDSFGNRMLQSDNGGDEEEVQQLLKAWVLYNDKLYCSAEDLYALQLDSKQRKTNSLLPFDRVIGSNEEAPLLILYGDIESETFQPMFQNLYQSAMIGKLRFLWRYIPSDGNRSESFSGYGIEARLKTTNSSKEAEGEGSRSTCNTEKVAGWKKLDLLKKFWEIGDTNHFFSTPKDAVANLGLKLTDFVLNNNLFESTAYEIFKTALEQFPKYAFYLSKMKKSKNIDKVREAVLENEKLGLSEESNGIYINGAPMNKLELDVFRMKNAIKEELDLVEAIEKLGFSLEQTKTIISKFALLSAVKGVQFRKGNSFMGGNENRFKVFEHEFSPGQEQYSQRRGVIFFNDIETDTSYLDLTEDRKEAYSDSVISGLRHGHIPPLKENVYDVVFAINLSDKKQLKSFFTIAKFTMDSKFPLQVGLTAIINSEADRELAEMLYFLSEQSSKVETMAFLFKYLEAKSEDEENDIFDKVRDNLSHNFNPEIYQHVLRKFSINTPSIICNGVIYDLDADWYTSLRTQIAQDVKLLKIYVRDDLDKGRKLKDILYYNAKEARNLRVVPIDSSSILYKRVDESLMKIAYTFKQSDETIGIPNTIWLIGDGNSEVFKNQLLNALYFMKNGNRNVQLKVISFGLTSVLKDLKAKFKLNSLNRYSLGKIIEFLNNSWPQRSNGFDKETAHLLTESGLPLSHCYLLINSRYARADDVYSIEELEGLIDYENNLRLKLFNDILSAYPSQFEYLSLYDYKTDNLNVHDWFDLLSSIVTKSFYKDDNLFINDVARYDFSTLNLANSFVLNPEEESTKIVEILLIADPVSEDTQKYVSIINAFSDFLFVTIRVLMQPQLEFLESSGIQRFYKGVFPSSSLNFDLNGKFTMQNKASLKQLPENVAFIMNLDQPLGWITTESESSDSVDATHYTPRVDTSSHHYLTYELKYLLVEGFAKEVRLGTPPTGLALEIYGDKFMKDTSVMSNLGYFQLQTIPGAFKLRVKPNTKSSEYFSLLSASSHQYDSNQRRVEESDVMICSLDGLTLRLRTAHNPGFEGKMLYDDSMTEGQIQKEGKRQISFFGKSKAKIEAPIVNVFAVANGNLYERFLKTMMVSVVKNTKERVKFWILENFISFTLRNELDTLSETYGFDYSMISFKWPNWLRYQKEKHRVIWGYKILFLDVLFPQELEKVVFIDADQVVRGDLNQLVQLDLQGAPYGFVPMCDSRPETEGFRFWKSGYWAKILNETDNYHISALFVVDLTKFRSIHAGDILRSHYQRLSSDPNSLANLDQDLPNNLQKVLPIMSLPQEWLWCETWCSDESLKHAKSIDLCSNPLTNEDKVSQAKRMIPEWNDYDNEITEKLAKAELAKAKLSSSTAQKSPSSAINEQQRYQDEL